MTLWLFPRNQLLCVRTEGHRLIFLEFLDIKVHWKASTDSRKDEQRYFQFVIMIFFLFFTIQIIHNRKMFLKNKLSLKNAEVISTKLHFVSFSSDHADVTDRFIPKRNCKTLKTAQNWSKHLKKNTHNCIVSYISSICLV